MCFVNNNTKPVSSFIDDFCFFVYSILSKQREVAMIAEMIHSASLIHDDVIDQADFRRGKPSANVIWSHKKVFFFALCS